MPVPSLSEIELKIKRQPLWKSLGKRIPQGRHFRCSSRKEMEGDMEMIDGVEGLLPGGLPENSEEPDIESG